MSSARMRLFFRPSGTSPLTMRCARPSTMAVLPTPGSPISTGLFLVRRCSTWMVRRISSSRPMTGSSLPEARARGQIDGVLLERLALLLGVGDRPPSRRRAPPRSPSRPRRAPAPRLLERRAERAAILERRQHEQLAGDELIAALLRELVGDVEQPVAGRSRCARRRPCPRPSAGRSSSASSSARSLLTSTPALISSGRTRRPGVEHRQQQVRGLDELVVAADGQRLRIGQRRWNRLVSLSMRMGSTP